MHNFVLMLFKKEVLYELINSNPSIESMSYDSIRKSLEKIQKVSFADTKNRTIL